MMEEGKARSGVARVPLAAPEVHNKRVEEGVGEWLLYEKADRKINQAFEEEEWQMEGDRQQTSGRMNGTHKWPREQEMLGFCLGLFLEARLVNARRLVTDTDFMTDSSLFLPFPPSQFLLSIKIVKFSYLFFYIYNTNFPLITLPFIGSGCTRPRIQVAGNSVYRLFFIFSLVIFVLAGGLVR